MLISRLLFMQALGPIRTNKEAAKLAWQQRAQSVRAFARNPELRFLIDLPELARLVIEGIWGASDLMQQVGVRRQPPPACRRLPDAACWWPTPACCPACPALPDLANLCKLVS